MNLPELQKKLLVAARRNPPGAQVPYAFEKRIMARLTEAPRPSEWLAWSRALWFGAAACAVIALTVSVWAPSAAANGDTHFSDGIVETIMASSDEFDSNW